MGCGIVVLISIIGINFFNFCYFEYISIFLENYFVDW